MSEELKEMIEKLKDGDYPPEERSILTGEIVRILQENPKGFYENSGFLGEPMSFFLDDLVGVGSRRSNEEKKEVLSSFLSHTAVVEIVLAEGTSGLSSRYFQEYFNKNFATINENLNLCIELDGREKDVLKGFRESLLKGIVSQGIIIDKDGNFQTKNAEESLDKKTAQNDISYYMDEEFVKEIIKRVYKLETYTDVKEFYNNIDVILGEDIQTEGTVINSLCNCSTLGKMRNFREADDRYGPNTKFEYLKSLAYSEIKDRLEEIKKDREKFTDNTEKKAKIDDIFKGWLSDGEQK